MVEISSPDDLEKWLQEKSVECSQIMALRCSLRVVPMLNEAVTSSNLNDNLKNQLILSVFRASLIAGVAADLPNLGTREVAHAAADAAADVAARAASDTIASATTRAAHAAARSAAHTTVHAAARSTTFAVVSAAHASNASIPIILNQDVPYLQLNETDENSSQKLLILPLWHSQKNPLDKNLQDLKELLIAVDPDWQFWIDWYQAKLDGTMHQGLTKAQQDDLYYQIATFPNELWEESAEAVNQLINQLMEEIKKGEVNDLEEEIEQPLDLEIPPQNEGALQFKTNEDGIIELDQEAIENELLNDQGAIDRHNEVDYLANELISSYDPNSSSANAARPIVTKVQRYLEALGDTPEDVNINFIIPRGEVLRQELEREENRDEFTSSPPLPDEFKSSLASLVSAHNLYVVLDPVLDKRDQARLGPDAKENLVSKEDGLKIVEDAFSEGLIEEEVAEILHEEAEAANEIPDPERRQDRRFSEIIKNLSRALLSNAQSIAKKIKEKQSDIIEVTVAGAGGAAVVTGSAIVVSSTSWAVIAGALGVGASASWVCFKILQNVVKNEDIYLKYFNHSKEMKSFIEALKKLPLK